MVPMDISHSIQPQPSRVCTIYKAYQQRINIVAHGMDLCTRNHNALKLIASGVPRTLLNAAAKYTVNRNVICNLRQHCHTN